MNQAQRASQMVIAGLAGEGLTDPARKLIEQQGIGGFILQWGRNFTTLDELKTLTHSLQEAAKRSPARAPLWMAIEISDGLGQWVPSLLGGAPLPSALALGASGRTEDVLSVYETLGAQLRGCGINLVLAPLLNIQPNDAPPECQRLGTLGASAKQNALLAASLAEALESQGIVVALGTFPGLESCEESAKVQITDLQEDLVNMARSQRVIMLGHTHFQEDPAFPTTLSQQVLSSLIREKYGIQALLVSAPLDDPAIAKLYSAKTATSLAAAAGIELMVQRSPDEAMLRQRFDGILKAVHSGHLSENRLTEICLRLLDLKRQTRDQPAAQLKRPALSAVDRAARSVVLVRDQALLLPLKGAQQKIVVVSPGSIVSLPRDPARDMDLGPTLGHFLRQVHENMTEVPISLVPDERQTLYALEAAQTAEVLVIGLLEASHAPEQQDLVHELLKLQKPTVLIALGTPGDLALFPEAPAMLASHGMEAAALEATAGILVGKLRPEGKLALPAGPEYPAGHALTAGW